jgi:hypothetical protein
MVRSTDPAVTEGHLGYTKRIVGTGKASSQV